MTHPLGVVFIAPSVTTFVGLNPGELIIEWNHLPAFHKQHTHTQQKYIFSGYRVYYVDGNYQGSSRLVLDHETYIMNLTEANHSPWAPHSPQKDPKWTLLYRATEAYGLSTLFPSDFNRLIGTFINDDPVFQKFWYLRYKGHVSKPCKEVCKTGILCYLRSGRYDDLKQCDYLNGFKGSLARAATKTLCWSDGV